MQQAIHVPNPYQPPLTPPNSIAREKIRRYIGNYVAGVLFGFMAGQVAFVRSPGNLIAEFAASPIELLLIILVAALLALITSLGILRPSRSPTARLSRFIGGATFGFSPIAFEVVLHYLLPMLGWGRSPALAFSLFWITIGLGILTGILFEQSFRLVAARMKVDPDGMD